MKQLALIICIGLLSNLTIAQDQIDFKTSDGVYPSGIAYLPQQDAFLVSSIAKGQIGMVDRQGNYSVFMDSDNFYSTVGLKVKDDKLDVVVWREFSDKSKCLNGLRRGEKSTDWIQWRF